MNAFLSSDDIVAGITVGLIVVPQGMSYAKVAGLPVQHGLYSAYIGAIFYCFMGTSKDLTIGPTAVISLITGELVAQLADHYSPAQVAGMSCLAVGALTMILGVFRLGIVLDFFPSTVLVGYTTGAAATIVVSQIPKWIGVSGVNTREPPLQILLNTFRAMSTLSWLDLLFGILSMMTLVGLGSAVDRWGRGRFSIQMIKISRFFIVTVLATWCSFMVHMGAPLDADGNLIPRISILKTVPAGLPPPQAPPIDRAIVRQMAPQLLAISLATILEHIAIGKAFARKNRYQIDGNQELLTLGLANVTASFFGAYTVTGSFSRSAVNFQCGVKTPMAGFVTGALVLLALHVLTPLFFYIPDAALSAVIMVAVSSLISPPAVFLEFFHVNLWDFLSSQVALWVTLFVSVEAGIASGVGFSLLVLLFRVARPQLYTLRPLKQRTDVFVASSADLSDSDYYDDDNDDNHSSSSNKTEFYLGITNNVYDDDDDQAFFDTVDPPPGILIFRMEEAATFPNMETFKTWAQDQAYKYTRFGGLQTRTAQQDRLWSDDLEIHIRQLRAPRIRRSYRNSSGSNKDDDDDDDDMQQRPLFSTKDPRTRMKPRTRTRTRTRTWTEIRTQTAAATPLAVTTQLLPDDEDLPRLRAVILDCSAMNQIDSTGLQGLRDLRENLSDYAGAREDPSLFFELHFVAVQRNVLPILRRSGLLTPPPPPPVPTPERSLQIQIHPPPQPQQQHQQQRVSQDSHRDLGSNGSDRGSVSSYGSFARRGVVATAATSIPRMDSLVHLTIQDAIHAILRRAGDTGTSLAGDGGQAVEEDAPWAVSDSDESEHAPSLHKYSSTHALHVM
ncbi:hypothetical protein EC968_002676 [Mortierella alpina]|nr:hypothetical protein EC968_002676 [Mortierella alpina]